MTPTKNMKLKYAEPGTDPSPAVGNSISCTRFFHYKLYNNKSDPQFIYVVTFVLDS